MLNLLDLFSGIGGFSYAAERIVTGYKTVQFVENDLYCQQVLRKHWPTVPIHDDVRTFRFQQAIRIDVITAGFPCQDLSKSGNQSGLSSERSGLFYEVFSIANEVRPKAIIFENVPHIRNHEAGETFQKALFQIAKAGYDAEWACISASDVSAKHKRERWWLIAYAKSFVGDDCRFTLEQREELRKLQFGGDNCEDYLQPTKEPLWRPYDENNKRFECNPSQSWFESEPTISLRTDGLSQRLAPIMRAIGNSVAPQCAAIPLQRVKTVLSNCND